MLNRKNSQFSHNSKIDLLEKRKRFAIRSVLLLVFIAIGLVLWQANRDDKLDLTALLPQELRNNSENTFYNTSDAEGYTITEQSLDGLSGIRYFSPEGSVVITLPLDAELSYHASVVSDENTEANGIDVMQLFVSGFESSGFNQIQSDNELLRAFESENNIKRFRNEQTECTLDVSAIDDSAVVVRACSRVDDVDSRADLPIELFSVFKSTNNDFSADIVHIYADESDVEQSIAEGHEYIVANIGNLDATTEYVFVRSENGPWQYFGPQNDGDLSCEIYQDDIIKQSLAHFNCLNPDNLESTTVKEYFEI